MRKVLGVLLLVLVGVSGFAQSLKKDTVVSVDSLVVDSVLKDSVATVVRAKLPPGKIVTKIDSFYYSTSALQKKINQMNCPDLVDGFRAQIFSCSGQGCQEKVNKQFNQFLIAYPDVPVYKIWQAPTIKVRVGDCRTRFEAEKIKNTIKGTYQHVFVVPDYIDSPYKIDCEDMQISKSDSLLYLPLR